MKSVLSIKSICLAPPSPAAGCAVHSIFLSISRQTRLASSRHSPQEIILASWSGPGPRLGVSGVNAAKLLPNDHFLHLRQGNVTPGCSWDRETGIELRFKHYLNTVTISRCLLRGVTKPQPVGAGRGFVIVCRQSRLGGGMVAVNISRLRDYSAISGWSQVSITGSMTTMAVTTKLISLQTLVETVSRFQMPNVSLLNINCQRRHAPKL